MTDLEYKIGGLTVNPERILFEGSDPYDATHLFVVQALTDSVLIFVNQGDRHARVARKFGLRGNIVGGGSCYTNEQKELVLNDYSGDYDAIPKEVAQAFAELMLPELEKLGIEISGIAVNPTERMMNYFWREKGFGSQ